MKVNMKMINEMDMADIYGILMIKVIMKENGKMICLMGRENLFIRMELFMKGDFNKVNS